VVSAKRKVRAESVRVTESCGNVFADLGVPRPERELMKAELALQIYRIIRRRKLMRSAVATMLGVAASDVSVLMLNRAGKCSVGELRGFLEPLRGASQVRRVNSGEGSTPSTRRGLQR